MMTKSAANGVDGSGGTAAATTAVHRHKSPQKMPSQPLPPPPLSKKRPAADSALPSSAAADVPSPLLPGVPQPPAKFRKRQSSCYAHLNVRDPLNLGSVRPDNPDDPNFAKPIQLIPTNVNDPLNLQNLSPADGASGGKALAAEVPTAQQKRKRKRTTRAIAPLARDESDEPNTSDDLSPPPPLSGASRRFTWKREMTATTSAAIATTSAATFVADKTKTGAFTVGEMGKATVVVTEKVDAERARLAEDGRLGVGAASQPSTLAAASVAAEIADGAKATTDDETAAAAKATRWERRRKMAERYRYGNFNHYQMRREIRLANAGAAFFDPQQQHLQQHQPLLLQAVEDPRVRFFCPDWFGDKAVLDIGSNAGHFAISLARAFQPLRVIGVDIDSHLVGAARKNIRHFCDKDTKMSGKFPASFAANFGPISAPSTSDGPHFPDNVWFFCENYVLPSDAELEKVHEEFDIIFALACSKWVHLNWGDAGIRRFFLRAFRQLRTGGRFVLETAPFKDYRKHCKKAAADRPPEEVLRNFGAIRFHPDEFTAFLLNTVGFSHHEELDSAHSKALGISGRLQVFYKGQFMLTENADDREKGKEAAEEGENVAATQPQQQQQVTHEESTEKCDGRDEQMMAIDRSDDA